VHLIDVNGLWLIRLQVRTARELKLRITRELRVPKKKSPKDIHFGERLRQLRESRSLNVTELAKRISVSPAAIWHWENRGTKPRSRTIDAVADALGVARDFLEDGVQGGLEVLNATRGSNGAHPNSTSSAVSLSLEELMRAIEAKGFDVYVRSKDSRLGNR
jgi:transcriptional regulator with XRE-family HTH domain